MNQKITVFFLLLMLIAFRADAEKEFKDVIVTGKYICGLTSNGTLKFFDPSDGRPVGFKTENSSEILCITTDHSGHIVIADRSHSIKRYNESQKNWDLIATFKGNVFGIVFDSRNQCFGITEKGILSFCTNKYYGSGQSLNSQIHYKGGWGKPYCYYMDQSDKIWLGFGYGEWGGNLFVFETTTGKFLTPQLDSFNIELWPIKSFFEDEHFTYLSAGLQHMMTSGTIIKFDSLNATIVLNSETKWDETNPDNRISKMMNGEYIGPATYNPFNHSFYFYSQNGIFRGNPTADLSRIENWVNVLKPELHWVNGQRDAVGSPMNVLKIIPIDKDRYLFLTQKDGIGFFNGEQLLLLE